MMTVIRIRARGDFFIREEGVDKVPGAVVHWSGSEFWDFGWHQGVIRVYSSASDEAIDCPKNWVLV